MPPESRSRLDRASARRGLIRRPRPCTLPPSAAREKDVAENLRAEHFQPHEQKIFRVKGGRHALKLAHVEVLAIKGGQRHAFNLIFTGPPGDVLREGLYVLQVENGPEFELYVMPIHTPSPGQQDYQALFN
jgi:hypothetical protein